MKNSARYSALEMNASPLVIPGPLSVIIPKTNLDQIFEYPWFLEKFHHTWRIIYIWNTIPVSGKIFQIKIKQ